MGSSLVALRKNVRAHANAERATAARRFFKTGAGQYGEGDRFLGLTMPEQRAIAKRYRTLAHTDIPKLLHSTWHEERCIALLIMIEQFERGTPFERTRTYELYLANTRWVNNWDLVDVSAYKIVGGYLCTHPRGILMKLAKSKDLWERRIAIISTMELIAHDEFADTLRIAPLLLRDDHDLIHKAVGWMLREVGKRSRRTLESFLARYAHAMPRTMLRYAIEKFPEQKRRAYLSHSRSA